MKGDFHYMSPERLENAPRNAANDIWSIGATFVQMITGQQINHLDNLSQFFRNVTKYKIFINGIPYYEFLKTLNDDDYKKHIVSRTLCTESNRANCQSCSQFCLNALPSPRSRRSSDPARGIQTSME